MSPYERDTRNSEPIGSNSPWVTGGSRQVYGTAFSHGPERHGNEPGSPRGNEPGSPKGSGGLVDRIRRLLRRR